MNTATIAALLEVNRRFYDRFAAEFSASRERSWPGWDLLLERLAETRQRTAEALAVLDVGCGNGRFASHLLDRWPQEIRYLGIDRCAPLLDSARDRLRGRCRELRLRRLDLAGRELGDALGRERFDLIALFGVLHHLPGVRTRRRLLRTLAGHLARGGILAVTVWQRHRRADFGRKVLPWSRYNRRARPPLDLDQLETGDVLLTWAGDAETPRYCHFPGAAEIDGWTVAVALQLRDRFESDGADGRSNLYLLYEA